MTRVLRRVLALLTALVLIAITATLVFGVETRLLDGKLRTGDIVTVPASETWDGNLYLLAGQVTVDGDVDGDLVAFGGTIAVITAAVRRCARGRRPGAAGRHRGRRRARCRRPCGDDRVGSRRRAGHGWQGHLDGRLVRGRRRDRLRRPGDG